MEKHEAYQDLYAAIYDELGKVCEVEGLEIDKHLSDFFEHIKISIEDAVREYKGEL